MLIRALVCYKTYYSDPDSNIIQILRVGNAVTMFIAATLGDTGQLKPMDKKGFPPLDDSFKTFYKLGSSLTRASG